MASTTESTDEDASREVDIRDVLHQSGLPIAMFDLDDMRFIDANAAARALVGLGDDDELPEKISDIVVGVPEEQLMASLRLLNRRALLKLMILCELG